MRIIDEATLDRFRSPGRCEWCGQWCARREPDHIVCIGTGQHKRLDIPINLLALGSSANLHPCHTFLQRRDEDLRRQIVAIVAARERTTPEDIQAVVWALLRIPKEGRQRDIEREIKGLTGAQQALYWEQLGYAARVLPPSDPDPKIEEPPF